MCAIIGFRGTDHTGLMRVLDESRVRGLHAFGYAFPDINVSDGLRVRKFSSLEEMKRSIMIHQPTKLIAHCRYATSGDWRVLANNQPVSRGGLRWCSTAF